MTFPSLVLLALGLAMDAAAVSAARGLAVQKVTARHVLLVAVYFGGFQALMPCLGFFLGAQLGTAVATWEHWIAFALLSSIGAKMIWDALHEEKEDMPSDPFAPKVMLLLAIATSIDAFAAGVTLPMLHAPLLPAIATIGVVTAACSALGLLAGRRFGALLGKRLDVFGGIVLIGLGLRILISVRTG